MTKDELKQRVYQAIEQRGEEIIGLGEEIRRHPELGFKEVKTARLVEETFKKLGLAPRSGLAMTGVRAEVAGRGGEGPTFALLGELDALVVAGHPEGDTTTGAAHACGHNAQIAGILGAAMGLLDARALDALSGRVVFFAVPGEEYGDIEWRVAQARAGKLEFLGGKPELLRLGHCDDVDLSMMIHLTSRPEDGRTGVPASNNGCIVKTIRYVGRASHAGGAPHLGVNALYAAQVGLTAVNAIRETFRDEDTIRVHPIITHGGSQVNVIPGEVRLETYVRGRTVDAILDAQKKVDRAFKAGALALGAKVEIETLPGYMPMACDPGMARHYEVNAAKLVGAEHYRQIGHRTGSTDMGDLSMVMPILHPYVGGATGSGHGADYKIVDPQLAYVTNAKALAAMAVDMLAEGAAGAREVLKAAKPPMTREQYLAFQRGLARRETYEGGDAARSRSAWRRFCSGPSSARHARRTRSSVPPARGAAPRSARPAVSSGASGRARIPGSCTGRSRRGILPAPSRSAASIARASRGGRGSRGTRAARNPAKSRSWTASPRACCSAGIQTVRRASSAASATARPSG